MAVLTELVVLRCPCRGAVLWTVVKVVVREWTDCAGDEKVLFRSPSVFAAVALVPALDCTASDTVVSAVVDNVGAMDLGGARLSWEIDRERLLCETELCRDLADDKVGEKAA